VPKCAFPIAPQGSAPLPQPPFWGDPLDAKKPQKGTKTHVVSQVRSQVASEWPPGGARDALGLQRLLQWRQKVLPWSTPGAPNPQNMVFYNGKTLIFTKSRNLNFSPLLASFVLQGATKVVPKMARGRPRVRPGEPPGPQGCQKVTKKVTKNEEKWHHLATPRPKAVPGRPREPFGVPPSWQSVQKREKKRPYEKMLFLALSSAFMLWNPSILGDTMQFIMTCAFRKNTAGTLF